MSQKEKAKALIDFYKAIILAILTALFGVLGYTFVHYKDYTTNDFIIVLSCIISIVFALAVLIVLFKKELQKIEKD